MKRIAIALLVLIAMGWTTGSISASRLARADGLTPWDWRRTCQGWQQAEWLMPPAAQRRPPLHPAVVAMLELLLSIGGLAAFPVRDTARGSRKKATGSVAGET